MATSASALSQSDPDFSAAEYPSLDSKLIESAVVSPSTSSSSSEIVPNVWPSSPSTSPIQQPSRRSSNTHFHLQPRLEHLSPPYCFKASLSSSTNSLVDLVDNDRQISERISFRDSQKDLVFPSPPPPVSAIPISPSSSSSSPLLYLFSSTVPTIRHTQKTSAVMAAIIPDQSASSSTEPCLSNIHSPSNLPPVLNSLADMENQSTQLTFHRNTSTPTNESISFSSNNESSPNSSNNNNNNNSNTSENTGRWTAEEHRLFLQGLEQHGKGWKKIATLIQTRTVVQIRTHAQKYFQKLAKARASGEGGALIHGQDVGLIARMTTGGVGADDSMHSGGTLDGTKGAGMGLLPNGAIQSIQLPSSVGGSNMTSLGKPGISSLLSSSSQSSCARKRRPTNPTDTRRHSIGSVVRSAVREGRNVKRQKIAEAKRKNPHHTGTNNDDACLASEKFLPPGEVPNPLPSISNILDPYVMAPLPPAVSFTATSSEEASIVTEDGVMNKSRGRQQLVHTATHGTLPMAALEDAVFRLLTPAPGATNPPLTTAQHHHQLNSIDDPLAPNPPAKISVASTFYHSSGHAAPGVPSTAAGTAGASFPNSSPTCVSDMSTFPSWVDAKNPPTWYNEGSDIDALLEDAECLNWLHDTGDLEETYPPAVAAATTLETSLDYEPTPVDSTGQYDYAYLGIDPSYTTIMHPFLPTSGEAINTDCDLHAMAEVVTVHDPTTAHPSTESLSFLVDSPKQELDEAVMSSFMDAENGGIHENDHSSLNDTVVMPYASATEAVTASTTISNPVSNLPSEPSHGNLLSFSDLDIGDEHAFVSALLENSGQSTVSFSKWNSELQMSSEMDLTGVVVNEEGIILGEEAEL